MTAISDRRSGVKNISVTFRKIIEKPDEHGMKSDLTTKYRQMVSLPLALLSPLILL